MDDQDENWGQVSNNTNNNNGGKNHNSTSRRNFLIGLGLAGGGAVAGYAGGRFDSSSDDSAPTNRTDNGSSGSAYDKPPVDPADVDVTVERVDPDSISGDKWPGDDIRTNPDKMSIDYFATENLHAIERAGATGLGEGYAQEVAAGLAEAVHPQLIAADDTVDDELYAFVIDDPVSNNLVDNTPFLFRLLNFNGHLFGQDSRFSDEDGERPRRHGAHLLDEQHYDKVAGVSFNYPGDVAGPLSRAAMTNSAHFLHELDKDNLEMDGMLLKDDELVGGEEGREGLANFYKEVVVHEDGHTMGLPHLLGEADRLEDHYTAAEIDEKLEKLNIDEQKAREQIRKRYDGREGDWERAPPSPVEPSIMLSGYTPLLGGRRSAGGDFIPHFRTVENKNEKEKLIDDWHVNLEFSDDSIAKFLSQITKEEKRGDGNSAPRGEMNRLGRNYMTFDEAVQHYHGVNDRTARQIGSEGGYIVVNDLGLYEEELGRVADILGDGIAGGQEYVEENK